MRHAVFALCAFVLMLAPNLAAAQSSTTLGVGSGAVAGAIVGGPIGAVIGGVAGGLIGANQEPRRYRAVPQRGYQVRQVRRYRSHRVRRYAHGSRSRSYGRPQRRTSRVPGLNG